MLDEIPSWQQDNEYVLAGYRQPSRSYKRCFQTLAYVHNETVNIYSHLIGAAFSHSANLHLSSLIPAPSSGNWSRYFGLLGILLRRFGLLRSICYLPYHQ